MRGLTADQRQVIAQFGRLLWGQEAQDGCTERVIQRFEEWFCRLQPEAQWMIRGVLSAIQWLPLVSPSPQLFSRMSDEQARAFVERIRDPYRLAVLRAAKGLCGMSFLLDEAFEARIGYAQRPLREPPLPLSSLTPLPVVYPDGDGVETADVVVIGSGAGGATVAMRLAEAGLHVVVLEEGELAHQAHTQLPLHERVRLFYRANGFTATVGVPPIFLPMGCTVGGTTVVNSGTCFRTPPFILERWQHAFGVVLEQELVEAYFERIERDLAIQPVPDEVLGGNGRVLQRGAERLGVRHAPLMRPQRECHGTGVCAFVCPRGAKLDMRLSYLPRAVRAGARIYARTRAERILMAGNRAVGVEAQVLDVAQQPTGYRLQVRAQAVVVAAGTLYTPVLLWQSGVRHPHLGKHVHIHPSASVFAEMPERVEGWRGVMQSYGVTEWLEEGTLIEATFPPPAIGYALHPFPFWGERHLTLLERAAYLAGVGILTADNTSSGRILRLPNGAPLLHYRLTSADQQRILLGIARAARLLLAAGAQAVYTDMPGAECLRSEADIEQFLNRRWHAGHLSLSAYHPAGSCRMGERADLCPADSYGRVRGFEGLWVADASLVPTPTVVNPQVTVMMLAHRVADALLQRWKHA